MGYKHAGRQNTALLSTCVHKAAGHRLVGVTPRALSPQTVAVSSWAVLSLAQGRVPPPSPLPITGCHHRHFYLKQDKRLCPARQTSIAGRDSCNVRECCSLFFLYPVLPSRAHLKHLRMQHGLCDAALDNLLLSTLVPSSQAVFSKPAPISPAAKAIFLPLSGIPVASHRPCALHHNTTR